MYRQQKYHPGTIKHNDGYIGETIEQKVRRITTNKEPIKDGAPLIYVDRKEGVLPQYDIRTDRFELAVDAMDKVTKAKLARREARHNPEPEKTEPHKGENDTQIGGPESIQAT